MLPTAGDRPSARQLARLRAVLVEGFDAGEGQFFDVDSGLDSSGHGVVDRAVAAQSQEYFTFAVQHRDSQPGVLLVAGQW
jgi:hypothetical protein